MRSRERHLSLLAGTKRVFDPEDPFATTKICVKTASWLDSTELGFRESAGSRNRLARELAAEFGATAFGCVISMLSHLIIDNLT
jgi:hypothetical protein